MKWEKYTIKTTTAAEDYMGAMLSELGIEGIEIEDNVPLDRADQAKMFVDFPPELPPDDGTSRVSFYLEDDGTDHAPLLRQVSDALEALRDVVDIGDGTITPGETEDADWINNWKQYFSAFSVGDIRIRPSWEEDDGGDWPVTIEIDPGVSFGTGKHETTQLCIMELERAMGDGRLAAPRVLDIGCGSGILSIVALKLGAIEVVATDIDENCMESARENLAANGLSGANVRLFSGNLIDDAGLREKVGIGRYDVVLSNILAEVLIDLAPVAAECLAAGGAWITSGILAGKEDMVMEAMRRAHLEVEGTRRMGEWACVIARKQR